MLQLRKEISDYEELMRSLRRQLHTQPELSDREYDTQEFIIEFLKGLKLDEIQSMAETAVWLSSYARNGNWQNCCGFWSAYGGSMRI